MHCLHRLVLLWLIEIWLSVGGPLCVVSVRAHHDEAALPKLGIAKLERRRSIPFSVVHCLLKTENLTLGHAPHKISQMKTLRKSYVKGLRKFSCGVFGHASLPGLFSRGLRLETPKGNPLLQHEQLISIALCSMSIIPFKKTCQHAFFDVRIIQWFTNIVIFSTIHQGIRQRRCDHWVEHWGQFR